MGEEATQEIEFRQFNGMVTNADPTDLKPGISQVQVNVNGLKIGQLEVRRGLRVLRFEES